MTDQPTHEEPIAVGTLEYRFVKGISDDKTCTLGTTMLFQFGSDNKWHPVPLVNDD